MKDKDAYLIGEAWGGAWASSGGGQGLNISTDDDFIWFLKWLAEGNYWDIDRKEYRDVTVNEIIHVVEKPNRYDKLYGIFQKKRKERWAAEESVVGEDVNTVYIKDEDEWEDLELSFIDIYSPTSESIPGPDKGGKMVWDMLDKADPEFKVVGPETELHFYSLTKHDIGSGDQKGSGYVAMVELYYPAESKEGHLLRDDVESVKKWWHEAHKNYVEVSRTN